MPIPALIAAGATLAGTAANLWSSGKNRESQEKIARQAEAERNARIAKGQSYLDQVLGQLETFHQGQTQFATPEMKKEYQELIANYDPSSMVYEPEKFDFGKGVEEYMDPYTEQIIQQAGQNVLHQYGKSGMGDSGFEHMAAFRSEAEKMDELRKSAREEYQQDRDFAYKEYSDYINQMNNKYKQMADLTSQKINLLSGAIGHDEQQASDYMSDILAVQTTKAGLGL